MRDLSWYSEINLSIFILNKMTFSKNFVDFDIKIGLRVFKLNQRLDKPKQNNISK